MRIYDLGKIKTAIQSLVKSTEKVDVEEWLADPTNIALENEHGDLALFEYGFPLKKIYSGHYFFKSRGRQALQAARDFLDEIFNPCYNINVITGFTPVDNKAARWISRRVGFTSHGFEEIHGKEYELFILTKKEFYDE